MKLNQNILNQTTTIGKGKHYGKRQSKTKKREEEAEKREKQEEKGEVMNWKDLAPDICRQRLVIEGTLHHVFLPEDMTRYCQEITKVLDMTEVSAPVCNYDSHYGWCAYTHWKESGMHIYAWDNRTPKFFSIDIYTCKDFDPQHAVNYTEEFFEKNLIEIAWKE